MAKDKRKTLFNVAVVGFSGSEQVKILQKYFLSSIYFYAYLFQSIFLKVYIYIPNKPNKSYDY